MTARRKQPDSAGRRRRTRHNPVAARRPPATAWITDELRRRTIDLWSRYYRRRITEGEAVEILLNVKWLGEVMRKARREAKRS